MTEVTLHGHTVNIGDKVWSLSMPCGGGWGEVVALNDSDFPISVRFADGNTYYFDTNSPIIFWNEIDPAAIESARTRVKCNRQSSQTEFPTNLSENYLHLTNDQPGMLTGEELRKMYAEKLLEKNSWDDALYKICWRSFLAGVNTSGSVLLEIKHLSADLPDCPLKAFIDTKIVEVKDVK